MNEKNSQTKRTNITMIKIKHIQKLFGPLCFLFIKYINNYLHNLS